MSAPPSGSGIGRCQEIAGTTESSALRNDSGIRVPWAACPTARACPGLPGVRRQVGHVQGPVRTLPHRRTVRAGPPEGSAAWHPLHSWRSAHCLVGYLVPHLAAGLRVGLGATWLADAGAAVTVHPQRDRGTG